MDEKYIDELAKKSMETPREMEFDESAWEQLAGQMDVAAAATTAGGGAAALGSVAKVGLLKSLIAYGIAATLLVAVGVLGWQLSEVSDKNRTLQTDLIEQNAEIEELKADKQNLRAENAQNKEAKYLDKEKKEQDRNIISNKSSKEKIQNNEINTTQLEPKLAQDQNENTNFIDLENRTTKNNEVEIVQLRAALKQRQNELQAQLAINESLLADNERLAQLASQAVPFLGENKNDDVANNKINKKELQSLNGSQLTGIQSITGLDAVAIPLELKALEAEFLPDVEILPLPRRAKEFKRLSLGYHIDNVKLGTVAISGSTIRGAASVKSKGFKFEYRIFPSLSLSVGTESRNDTYEFLRNARPRGSRNGDKLEPWEPTHVRQKTSINLYSTAFPIALKYNFFPKSFVSPWVQAGLILSQSERQHIAVEFKPPRFPGRPQRPSYTREHADEDRKLYLSAYRLGAGVDVEIVPSFILQASMSLDQRIKALRPRFERKSEQQAQLAILYRF